MKNAVTGFFMIVILVFSGVCIQTAGTKTTRKNELDANLAAAMEQSMQILTIDPVYHISRDSGAEEFTADFIQSFLTNTTSDSAFTIEILKVDVEKGLLDVRVKETYKQVIGEGSVSCRKTVILEDVKEEEDVFYRVSFMMEIDEEEDGKNAEQENGEAEETQASTLKEIKLKEIQVHSGDHLSAVMLPKNGLEKKGEVFCGWKMVEPVSGISVLYGEDNIENVCVLGDMKFQAVYRKESE